MSRWKPGTEALAGLYAITPDCADTADLIRRSRLVLTGGARTLQYRNKSASDALRLVQATALRDLAHEFGVTFIVNDDVQLAAQVKADGVHLGEDDSRLAVARATLGVHKIIGVSCYNSLSRALEAEKDGANYVAFGAFFSSSIKPGALTADIGLLRVARTVLSVPLVAIGGITARNGAALVASGANALAVISALFDAADIDACAREFNCLFTHHKDHLI